MCLLTHGKLKMCFFLKWIFFYKLITIAAAQDKANYFAKTVVKI
jgi:hypothetical protein